LRAEIIFSGRAGWYDTVTALSLQESQAELARKPVV
jgi:hypothetical protein